MYRFPLGSFLIVITVNCYDVLLILSHSINVQVIQIFTSFTLLMINRFEITVKVEIKFLIYQPYCISYVNLFGTTMSQMQTVLLCIQSSNDINY